VNISIIIVLVVSIWFFIILLVCAICSILYFILGICSLTSYKKTSQHIIAGLKIIIALANIPILPSIAMNLECSSLSIFSHKVEFFFISGFTAIPWMPLKQSSLDISQNIEIPWVSLNHLWQLSIQLSLSFVFHSKVIMEVFLVVGIIKNLLVLSHLNDWGSNIWSPQGTCWSLNVLIIWFQLLSLKEWLFCKVHIGSIPWDIDLTDSTRWCIFSLKDFFKESYRVSSHLNLNIISIKSI